MGNFLYRKLLFIRTTLEYFGSDIYTCSICIFCLSDTIFAGSFHEIEKKIPLYTSNHNDWSLVIPIYCKCGSCHCIIYWAYECSSISRDLYWPYWICSFCWIVRSSWIILWIWLWEKRLSRCSERNARIWTRCWGWRSSFATTRHDHDHACYK